jgi:MFS family permease
MYTALIGMTWGVGCILGPLIGGAFSDSSATWRWVSPENPVTVALFSFSFIWSAELVMTFSIYSLGFLYQYSAGCRYPTHLLLLPTVLRPSV